MVGDYMCHHLTKQTALNNTKFKAELEMIAFVDFDVSFLYEDSVNIFLFALKSFEFGAHLRREFPFSFCQIVFSSILQDLCTHPYVFSQLLRTSSHFDACIEKFLGLLLAFSNFCV